MQMTLQNLPETPLEHCEWLNKLLMQVWLNYINPMLSSIFASIVERRLKHRKSRLIERIELQEFFLGSRPPMFGLHGTRWATSASTSRSLRGKVILNDLAKRKAKGVKESVQFNSRGQPFGRVASEMQSYIGCLARQEVKISYKSWKDVPREVKNTIWEYVNISYEVDPNWRADNGSISLKSHFEHRRYSQEEIDEVRIEWANCVLEHI